MPTLLELNHRLESLKAPDAKLSRGNINRVLSENQGAAHEDILDTLEIGELEREKLALIVEVLKHPEFARLVEEGHLTFGMVKPRREEAVRTPGSDEENTERLIAAIKPPLQVLIRQDFFWPREIMENFYDHLRPLAGGTVFERVVRDMSSRAVTALILFNPEGNAIQEWREQIGPTGADPHEPGETLRHRFGAGIENNGTHGSDSVENVKQDFTFLKEVLEKLL